MTDRPIIFSGPMVRALLEGRKTQTRRALYGKTGRMIPLASALPGDWLYVREAMDIAPEGKAVLTYACDSRAVDVTHAPPEVIGKGYVTPGRMPGMFMPRWASRLTLNVTAVRSEPLHAITDADAKAEGVELESADPPFWWVPGFPTENVHADPYCGRNETARDCYGRLWNHLNGPGSWEANPEVMVLTFTVEQRCLVAA